MTDTQKQSILEAQSGDDRAAFVDFTDDQLAVLIEYDKYDDRNQLAADAVNQGLKNLCRGAMNQAILAKDKAFRKGQKAMVEACEIEYQKAHALLNKL